MSLASVPVYELDAIGGSVTLAAVNSSNRYFTNSVAGWWFYFSPASWRVRLR